MNKVIAVMLTGAALLTGAVSCKKLQLHYALQCFYSTIYLNIAAI